MRYLTVNEVIAIHDAECGRSPVDFGLLESAVLRPQTTVGGQDAYPSLHEKAAAMMHSLARNHAFTDGNKRAALLATIVYYGMNGFEFIAEQSPAIALVLDAAEGQIDVPAIAKRLSEVVVAMDLREVEDPFQLPEPTKAVVDDDAPIVQVVDKILTQAVRDGASDVHVEPAEGCVRVRFRIDGGLKDTIELPVQLAPVFVSRVKTMADLNIVERRRPQEGQFELCIDGRSFEVHVSTSSTMWGERIVMRLVGRLADDWSGSQ